MLFEDTKKTHKGISFSSPITRIYASTLSEVARCLKEATDWQKKGYYVAGYIAYEAGWAFLPKKTREPQLPDYPLVDLYVFSTKNVFNSVTPDSNPAYLYNFHSNQNFQKYSENLDTIYQYLKQGDTYQVNYTQKMSLQSTEDGWGTYQTLRQAQRVEYGAYLSLKDIEVLSFSPELFIKKVGNKLTTRPMKGTKARDLDLVVDREYKDAFQADKKIQAENVMIVDLLRNDMGQIAMPGSVEVHSLFHIEEYETVFQMTSEINCQIQEGKEFHDIFATLFPCGSITGAPKLRTMEIINDVEKQSRGVYTGAIGYLDPNGDFCFNVAIRTLVKTPEGSYHYGLGGGILVTSNTDDEYQESLLKGRFLNSANSFYLFESFLYDGVGFRSLEEHLNRLEKSAKYFAFTFSQEKVLQDLQVLKANNACRVKLCLWSDGSSEVETHPLDEIPLNPEMVVSTTRIQSRSPFQFHKTSKRELYDQQYKKAKLVGFYEVLYLNENDHVAEASRHNIFAQIQGEWFTPPIESGVLPGIERAKALKDLQAIEKNLTLNDLREAEQLLLTNSVRGRVKVSLRDSL